VKTQKTAITVLAIALALTVGVPTAKAQEEVWRIGPRMLPVPVDVSDVMRESHLKTPVPNVETAKKAAPQTQEEWKATISDMKVSHMRTMPS